jgi:hypothetical protein
MNGLMARLTGFPVLTITVPVPVPETKAGTRTIQVRRG